MGNVENISLKYTGFALLASAMNLFVQEISIQIYSGSFDIYVGILNGTIIGLIFKYNLDKNYIFIYHPRKTTDDLKTFLMYGLTGTATTIIFWTTEILFHLIWETKIMRYSGAAIGLTFGYAVKYALDKHFVFFDRKN